MVTTADPQIHQPKVRRIEYHRPKLYPKQERVFFNPYRYSICEASTKSGKTVGGMSWLTEYTTALKEGQNTWWIAPVYSQARIPFRRLKLALPRWFYYAKEDELTLRLINGATMWFKSGEKPDNLYAEDVYACVIDEATRLKEKSWHAIRSTLTATRGPVRIIGNVHGKKNWAYKLARKAEARAPDMYYDKITADDAVKAGILDAAEIEDARRILPDPVFRELYLCEPSDDGCNPFGLEAIEACIGEMSGDDPAAYGIDLAKSVNWTVILGLNAQGRTCRFERFQKPWRETIERIKTVVGNVPALVDSTGVGDPIVEDLQHGGRTNYEGYKFTQNSKQQLMEGLAITLQNGQTVIPEGPVVNELRDFEYEYTKTGVRYSAPEGLNDDCVMGLALAVHKLHRPVTSWGAV
ncbi:MAG: hypothetical protein NOU37_09220 [Candidatus Brocadiales bacterium]|nr:hypothetical protein [Candidatus Bathyanammoxibius amoris]